MKKYNYRINIFLFLSVFIFLITVYFHFFSKIDITTSVEVNQKIIDIGKRFPDQIIDTIFKIKNTGDHDLLIKNVQSDCHCTVPSFTSKPIFKGEQAIIRVRYNNKNLGYFQQNIQVYANVNYSPIIFVLRGKTIRKN